MRGVWTVWLLSGPGQSACNDDSFVLDLDTNWGSLNCVTAWRDSPEYAAVFLVFIDLDIDIIKGSDPDQSFKLQYHYMSNMKQSVGCAECAAVFLLVTAALQTLISRLLSPGHDSQSWGRKPSSTVI